MDKDYDTWSAMLTIDKHDLDRALESHSHVMFKIGEKIAACERVAASLADLVKRHEGDAFVHAKKNDASDKAADAAKLAYPARLDTLETLQDMQSQLRQWSNLHEAWKQRGHALRELVQLYAVQYFSLDPAGGAVRKERAPVTRSTERPRR